MVGTDRVIEGKLRPPDLPSGVVDRARISERLDGGARVSLVVAPPGYGKSVAIRQWTESSVRPVAWLSVDLLDANPVTFWHHLVVAIRGVLPGVDEEAETALAENPRSDHFLAVLLAQIERSDDHATLVVDDLGRLDDRSVFEGLALLVERVGDRLRLCISGRVEPPLPFSRWRARGWVSDVTEDDLRLRDDEALAIAATLSTLHLGPDAVSSLNEHVDGWPIAFQLALVSRGEGRGSGAATDAGGGTDRVLADFLVGEILDQLPTAEREVALVLSVVDWFDTVTARELGGPGAPRAVASLQHRRLLSPVVGGVPGALRFHPLLRDLLDNELRWRDPVRHADLHRAAAVLARDRGDLNSAYRHLTAVGDDAAASALIVEPVLRLVDDGDQAGVSRMIGSLPPAMRVDDPALALDLAITWYFAGSGSQAATWCDRAERLGAMSSPVTELRLHAVRCILALSLGQLDEAAARVDAVEGLITRGAGTGPIERRFAIFAARVALARRDVDGARRWLDRSRVFGGPQGTVGSTITVPVLGASLDLLAGRLLDADAVAAAACEAAEALGVRPEMGALEALLLAAWCRFGAGDLAAADEYASAARVDAALLGWDANRIRAGAIAAEVRLLLDGPDAALAVIRDVRAHLDGVPPDVAAELSRVEAKALLRAGRRRSAGALLDALSPVPRVQLLRAALAIEDDRAAEVRPLLAGADRWPLAERLEADTLRSVVDVDTARDRLADALAEGAVTGWISPFVGHGGRVDAMLLDQPLDRLHPGLLQHLDRAPRRGTVGRIDLVDPITAREQTILELLPSHLSYAQIGEKLFLSVNTVKSNLKSIYRKLGVTTRADAVDAARAGRLI